LLLLLLLLLLNLLLSAVALLTCSNQLHDVRFWLLPGDYKDILSAV
jgi:hypothetical protein